MKPAKFLNHLQHDHIVEAIRQAEMKTSGEIRVFVTHRSVADPLMAAQKHFLKLGMDKTKQRNAVLIFVAPRSHQFAVIGDEAVHTRCGDGFWRDLAAEMTGYFKKSQFTEAIVHGVRKAGDLLGEHFPRRPGDKNQLPDDVVDE
ncbi:MAG TPA: TPM domain-containing protein [Verrucomicrobiae bacterium]|nr:TPM domain-containing protein [Verrucomicrobiae bacterium]